MTWEIKIGAYCDSCGRFTDLYRGQISSRVEAKAQLRRLGWGYDRVHEEHYCKECMDDPLTNLPTVGTIPSDIKR